jgi:hypothetical protein
MKGFTVIIRSHSWLSCNSDANLAAGAADWTGEPVGRAGLLSIRASSCS